MKISVVIPAKNRARTLPRCLDSVLDQTFPAHEVIVVDDASDDNTRAVVEGYADKGVRLARLEVGKGAQAARNHGIRIAAGDWIAFQDSDDVWFRHKLERQANALSQCASGQDKVVHCDGLKRDLSEELVTNINIKQFEGYCYPSLLLQSGPMFQGLLVPKHCLEAIDLLDEDCPSYQEWDTAIRLARICEFIHIREPLFEWIWHGGETISKDLLRDVNGFHYVLEKHREEICRIHGSRAWRKAKLMNVSRAMRFGYFDDALKMIEQERLDLPIWMARAMAKRQFSPRGSGMLFRLLSSL